MKTEPPREYQHFRWHVLDSERASEPSIAEWLDGRWFCINESGPVSSEELFRRGWCYSMPIILSIENVEHHDFIFIRASQKQKQ